VVVHREAARAAVRVAARQRRRAHHPDKADATVKVAHFLFLFLKKNIFLLSKKIV
jgi:hypothetical protein